MTLKRPISYYLKGSLLKPLSVFLMSLLLLLTIQNLFVYSADQDVVQAAVANSSEDSGTSNPAGPDEKSPNPPVSFNEEFIHKHTELSDPFWTNSFFNYIVTDTDKLHVTHFEIVSPPPDSSLVPC